MYKYSRLNASADCSLWYCDDWRACSYIYRNTMDVDRIELRLMKVGPWIYFNNFQL